MLFGESRNHLVMEKIFDVLVVGAGEEANPSGDLQKSSTSIQVRPA